jgi:hypothetical protein
MYIICYIYILLYVFLCMLYFVLTQFPLSTEQTYQASCRTSCGAARILGQETLPLNDAAPKPTNFSEALLKSGAFDAEPDTRLVS